MLFAVIIEEKSTNTKFGYGFDFEQNLKGDLEFETVVPLNFFSLFGPSSLVEKGFGLSLFLSRIRVQTADFKTLESADLKADEFPDNPIFVTQSHLVLQFVSEVKERFFLPINLKNELHIGYGIIKIDSLGRTFRTIGDRRVDQLEVEGPILVMKSGFAFKKQFEFNTVYLLSQGDSDDFAVRNTYLSFEVKISFK